MRSCDRTTRGRSAGFLMLALAATGLAGCGSLANPYLRFDDRPKAASKPPANAVLVRQIAIGEAVAYADKVKDRYRKAIGDDATFNRLLGVGLIGTATALPIMALNEARAKSLGIVGVYGAGAYALDAWLQSGPRQRAYIQGYNAVNCAVSVVLPLVFDQDQEPYISFDTAVNDIVSKIGDLEVAIAKAKIEIKSLSPSGKELGRLMVASARTAIAEAKEARRRGMEVRIRIAAAGGRLTSTVDRIIGEVDATIQANASDFSTLSGIIGGLGGIYGEFPGTPPISVFGSNRSQYRFEAETGGADAKLADLARETAAVASDMLVISDFLSALALAQPIETLKSCHVDPETITMAMSIHPDSVSFSGIRDETRLFLVDGGAYPYMTSIRGTDSNLISVERPDGFGPSFTITVKSGAPAGLYTIYVADGSRRTTSLPLEVVGKANDDGGDGIDAETPGGEAFGELDQEQRKRVQRALCVDDDGVWGPVTQAALQMHTGSGDSTDKSLQEQLVLSDTEVAARCGADGATGGLEQSLREVLDEASKAITDQSMDLAEPAAYAVAVTESTVTGAGDDLTLSVTISIISLNEGPTAAKVKVSAIREAVLERIRGRIQDPAITLDQIRITNLDALVTDGLVSND